MSVSSDLVASRVWSTPYALQGAIVCEYPICTVCSAHCSEEGGAYSHWWAEGQDHCGKRMMSELDGSGQCLVTVPLLWETEAQSNPR